MTRMNHRWVSGLAAMSLVLFTTSAPAQTKPQIPPQTTPRTTPPPKATPQGSKLMPADSMFLQHVATDGMAEMELADVAQTNAANADVKALATKIKNDHSQADAELKTLAASKGVTLPSTTTKPQQLTKARLANLKGASFDRAYVDAMVADHRKAVSDFTARTKSNDPDVKAFATRTLPALQDHLKTAQALQKQVK